MKLKTLLIFFLTVCPLIFAGCKRKGYEAELFEEWIEYKKAKCSTIEGVREFIQNEVWTYTDPIEEGEKFNMWCRIVFKDGKVYYYQVSPSKGEWGEPHICDYTIEEGRYSNTGEKYVAIRWKASWGNYSFVPETGALYCALGRQIYSCQTDFQDRNPWD